MAQLRQLSGVPHLAKFLLFSAGFILFCLSFFFLEFSVTKLHFSIISSLINFKSSSFLFILPLKLQQSIKLHQNITSHHQQNINHTIIQTQVHVKQNKKPKLYKKRKQRSLEN